MKQKTMAIPRSPTTKTHGKTMLFHAPPPPPPITYPPDSPNHHVMTRHSGGSYSSPRTHRSVLGMPVSPFGHHTIPGSPIAGSARLAKPDGTGAAAVATPPYLRHTPDPSHQRKVMEAAVAAERTRTMECEKEEANMTAEELRAILKKERRRTAKIAADLASFKSSAVQQQLESEVFEEGRINELMRRVDHLQHEKEKIIMELEREEEMLTNNLQKKLDEIRREKEHLEAQIDYEKKANSTLRLQLSELRNSQIEKSMKLEHQDEMEEE